MISREKKKERKKIIITSSIIFWLLWALFLIPIPILDMSSRGWTLNFLTNLSLGNNILLLLLSILFKTKKKAIVNYAVSLCISRNFFLFYFTLRLTEKV